MFINNDGEFFYNLSLCRSVKRWIWKCVYCFYKFVCLLGFISCFYWVVDVISSSLIMIFLVNGRIEIFFFFI